jgi:hypothetical protein
MLMLLIVMVSPAGTHRVCELDTTGLFASKGTQLSHDVEIDGVGGHCAKTNPNKDTKKTNKLFM